MSNLDVFLCPFSFPLDVNKYIFKSSLVVKYCHQYQCVWSRGVRSPLVEMLQKYVFVWYFAGHEEAGSYLECLNQAKLPIINVKCMFKAMIEHIKINGSLALAIQRVSSG